MIDWKFILQSYNNIKGTGFKSDKQLLQALYAELGNIEKMGEILGVTRNPVKNRMDRHGLKRVITKTETKVNELIAVIPAEQLRKMTLAMVVDMVECSEDYAWRTLKKQKRPYDLTGGRKWGKKGVKHGH